MSSTDCYEEVFFRLGELHKKLKRIQNQMLKEHHVSLMEYHILIMLLRKQSVSQNEMADELDVDKALISRHIQSMEQKGLLISCPDPDCRRKKVLSLSENAKSLLPKLHEIYCRSLEKLFADVDEKRLSEFQYILEGLVSKI